MKNSLLFIPDISGFTHFVQTTEAEHAQHVIAELLEILINSNTQDLQLAEVEGDALFFFKEKEVPSQEKLLAQIETMYTAFYSHLKMLEKNRICPCKACASAINLNLKIIVHSGILQFMEVQGRKKPFGESVITAHRLLKNSIESDNYVLLSRNTILAISMPADYQSALYSFKEGEDCYDNKLVNYSYSVVKKDNLNLLPLMKPEMVTLNRSPNQVFKRTYQVSLEKLFEIITNYRYRHLWAEGVQNVYYNENEVTRLETEHICVVNGKMLNFKAVARKGKDYIENKTYGEMTTSHWFADKLYKFFTVEPTDDKNTKLKVEIFWESNSLFQKVFLSLFGDKILRKNLNQSLDRLKDVF